MKEANVTRAIKLSNGEVVKVFKLGTIEVINTTNHPLNFIDPDDGEIIVPTSGIVVSAKAVEKVVMETKGVKLVRTEFVPDNETQKLIEEIIEKSEGSILLIGSVIAAQAYPQQIVAMTPAQGYERAKEKKMNPRKFVVF